MGLGNLNALKMLIRIFWFHEAVKHLFSPAINFHSIKHSGWSSASHKTTSPGNRPSLSYKRENDSVRNGQSTQ
jgi:hypothetical protein